MPSPPPLPLALFLLCPALTFLARQSAAEQKLSPPAPRRPSSSPPPPASSLSARGSRSLRPVLSYFPLFLSCLENLASPDNPAGRIPLCVAENKLVTKGLLSPRMEKALPSACANHQAFTYVRGARSAERGRSGRSGLNRGARAK